MHVPVYKSYQDTEHFLSLQTIPFYSFLVNLPPLCPQRGNHCSDDYQQGPMFRLLAIIEKQMLIHPIVVCLFLPLPLSVVLRVVIKCIHIYDLLVFFMDWTFYHYEKSFFTSGNPFILRSTLSNTNVAKSSFVVLVFIYFSILLLSNYLSLYIQSKSFIFL